MRLIFLLVALCFCASPALAVRKNAASLKAAAQSLDKALEQRDTSLLNRILSSKLQYGHSNGWIESKEEVKTDLYNGKITYRSIKDNGQGPQLVIVGSTGLVREDVAIDVLLDGKPINLNLAVLQVWVFEKGAWKLIGRQSTKVERH
jgi:hypothetical protein